MGEGVVETLVSRPEFIPPLEPTSAAEFVERGNRCCSDGVYERAIADYDYTVAIDLDASEEV